MFIAMDNEQNRINSLLIDEETLRTKSRNKEILCPDCEKPVRFRSGTMRPHFYHARNECVNIYSEPESETHLKGKTLIYDWLKSLYPSANVQLEWKVDETNQRSDVMIIHENGEKWAFEFQCSPISESVWNERHQLYNKAGVRDFWIISSDVNKHLKGESDTYRITRDLEKSVFKAYNHIYYLEVEREVFHIVRGGEFTTRTILFNDDQFFHLPMAETTVTGMELWHNEMLRHFADYEQIHKVDNNDVLSEIVWAELERINKIIEEETRQDQNNYFRKLVLTRNSEWGYLTRREKQILKELMQKHSYTLENLPGFFFSEVPAQEHVETPGFLIQFWLYDQLIYQKSEFPSKKHGFPVLWSPNALKSLNKLKNRGGYRVKSCEDLGVIYDPKTSLVDDIMELWRFVGLIKSIGKRDRFYHQIICDYLPPHTSLQESIFVEWQYRPKPNFIPTPDDVYESTRNYQKMFGLLY